MATGATVGSTLPYSFVVTNTGNVTLTGVWSATPPGGVMPDAGRLAPR